MRPTRTLLLRDRADPLGGRYCYGGGPVLERVHVDFPARRRSDRFCEFAAKRPGRVGLSRRCELIAAGQLICSRAVVVPAHLTRRDASVARAAAVGTTPGAHRTAAH
jgi:hypothetical protein